MLIIGKGAEAIVFKEYFPLLKKTLIVKRRIPKSYRIKELDEKLRKERTRHEAKLLNKAKLANVKCPTVYFVNDFDIGMEYIRGKKPKMTESECEEAGKILASLHKKGIIHGDFTKANLLKRGNSLYVIDFGLGFFSQDIEDQAVDVLTALKSLLYPESFLNSYSKINENYKRIFDRVEEIKRRARYTQ